MRIVENQYSGITYEKDGTLKSLTNGSKTTPRASGRSWSPVPKALRTTASTSPSCMLRSRRPVGMSRRWTMLDGTWSVKVNGLTQKGTLVYQTIPQNVKFEAGASTR